MVGAPILSPILLVLHAIGYVIGSVPIAGGSHDTSTVLGVFEMAYMSQGIPGMTSATSASLLVPARILTVDPSDLFISIAR